MRLPNTITIAGIPYERVRAPDGRLQDIWVADHGASYLKRDADKRWRHTGVLAQLPVVACLNGPWMSTPEGSFRAACEATLRELSDGYTRKRDAILKTLVALDKGE